MESKSPKSTEGSGSGSVDGLSINGKSGRERGGHERALATQQAMHSTITGLAISVPANPSQGVVHGASLLEAAASGRVDQLEEAMEAEKLHG
ncbi:unnamed protein product [Chrysoparadoxa australica]